MEDNRHHEQRMEMRQEDHNQVYQNQLEREMFAQKVREQRREHNYQEYHNDSSVDKHQMNNESFGALQDFLNTNPVNVGGRPQSSSHKIRQVNNPMMASKY